MSGSQRWMVPMYGPWISRPTAASTAAGLPLDGLEDCQRGRTRSTASGYGWGAITTAVP